MPQTTERILITGADGFIGKHLLADLSARGMPFVAATRTGVEIDGHTSLAVDDIGARTDWRAALDGVSHVVHLAGRAHVLNETEADPEAAFMRVNAEGTARLAAEAVAAGVKRFVFLSSISVYDPELTHLAVATREEPKTPYGRSKLAGEAALREISGDAMEWSALRPPLVYGPGVGARFAQLLKLASLPVPLPLGGVHNRRSLLYVENLSDAIVTALDHPAAANGSFLLSDDEDISTPMLVSGLAAAMGKRAMLVPVPQSLCTLCAGLVGKGEEWKKLTGTLTVDPTEFLRATGWAPPFGMDDGLRRTAEWYVAEHRK